MAAQIIDGKAISQKILDQVQQDSAQWRQMHQRPLGLAVVQIGDDPASKIYVRNKRRTCAELGFQSLAYDLPATTPEEELLALVSRLNGDPAVDGLLVQLPLPRQIAAPRVIEAIDPVKDVDGFHPWNLGQLLAGQPRLVSCTPAGVMELLKSTGVPLAGKKAVVVGRSNNVGKPTALLLLQANATVTVCHSKTADLAAECQRADILVAAVGQPRLIRGEWVKPGAVVIDVGMNREECGLCGDVDFAQARERASHITPVPGGVGLMTIAMLMANTVKAARWREEKIT